MNEIARLCEAVGADVNHVRVGMGTDQRIGMSFLFSGIGYGGSCFPKDVRALIRTARAHEVDIQIPTAVEQVNEGQKRILPDKVFRRLGKDLSGRVLAVWGLAFKPRTDDVREAPALTVCRLLIEAGARVQAYDPEAMGTFEVAFGANSSLALKRSSYEALSGADALIICTEWNEFRNPDYARMKKLMKQALVFDGRNIMSRTEMKRQEFEYYPMGRPSIA
jgi:UDPglucose 6-dehydrogenase